MFEFVLFISFIVIAANCASKSLVTFFIECWLSYNAVIKSMATFRTFYIVSTSGIVPVRLIVIFPLATKSMFVVS